MRVVCRRVPGSAETGLGEEYRVAVAAHWERFQRDHPAAFDGPCWCLARVYFEDEANLFGDKQPGGEEGIVWLSRCEHSATSQVGTWKKVVDLTYNGEDFPKSKVLVFEMQLTTYKYSIYSHFTPQGRLESSKLNCYGVHGATIAADGSIVLGRRSLSAGVLPGSYDLIPAGVGSLADPIRVLQEEYEEELGMDLSRNCLYFLGVFDAGEEQNGKPEFSFVVKIQLSPEAILAKYRLARDASEHSEVVFLRGLEDVQKLRPLSQVALDICREVFASLPKLVSANLTRQLGHTML